MFNILWNFIFHLFFLVNSSSILPLLSCKFSYPCFHEASPPIILISSSFVSSTVASLSLQMWAFSLNPEFLCSFYPISENNWSFHSFISSKDAYLSIPNEAQNFEQTQVGWTYNNVFLGLDFTCFIYILHWPHYFAIDFVASCIHKIIFLVYSYEGYTICICSSSFLVGCSRPFALRFCFLLVFHLQFSASFLHYFASWGWR